MTKRRIFYKVSLNNSKGAALSIVIMILAVMSILGVSFLSLSLSESKNVIWQDKKMQAYYIARSGADATGNWIIRHPASATNFVGKKTDPVNHFTNGTMGVQVDNGAGADELLITSKGTVGGVDNSVKLVLKRLSGSSIVDKAIYSTNDLDITGMNVDGDVQSGGNIQYSTSGSNTFNGDHYPNSTKYIELGPFPEPPYYSEVNPVITTGTLEVSGQPFTWDGAAASGIRLGNVKVSNKGTITFKPNGKIMRVVVDSFTIDSNLIIDTSAGGRVELYVNSDITITTKGVINNSEPYNLIIYLKDNSKFEMQANKILNGYIIGPKATIEIQSAQSITNGAIIGNVVQKNGTTNGPNGMVNYSALPAGIDITQSVKSYSIVRWEK